jgi:cell division transport system permease protein
MLNISYNEIAEVVGNIIPFKGIPFSSVCKEVVLIFILAGIFFGLFGGMISIGRYLKNEGGDVVAW